MPAAGSTALVTVDMTKPGAQEYYNSLIECMQNGESIILKPTTCLINITRGRLKLKVLLKKGQEGQSFLSLSAGPVSVTRIDHLRQNANLWRISGDMWDDWSYIVESLELCRQWQDYVMPNHWPDCICCRWESTN